MEGVGEGRGGVEGGRGGSGGGLVRSYKDKAVIGLTDLGKKYAKYKITTNYHEESKWNAGFQGESKSNSKFSLVFCIYRVDDPFVSLRIAFSSL